MPKIKLPQNIKDAAVEFLSLKEVAREATNAANRQQTVLKNSVKSFWQSEQLPIGSYLRVAGFEFTYCGAEKTTYDKEAILALYDNEEITREQLLRIMNVDSKQLANVLGADQAADLMTTTVGDTLDVRVSSLPVENENDEFVMVERSIQTKKKRSVFGKRAEEKKQKQSIAKPRRAIKVRGDK